MAKRDLDQEVDDFLANDGVGTPEDLTDDQDDTQDVADDDGDAEAPSRSAGRRDDQDGDDPERARQRKDLGTDVRRPNEQARDLRQEQQQERLFPRADGTATDSKGNIVDPNTGQLIARNGSERRLWEKNQRTERLLQETQRRNEELVGQQASLKLLNEIPQRYGINNQELTQVMELAATFKRSPLEAARQVVALTLATGQYNLSDILGQEAGDAIEMRGIARMIDERIAPLQQLTQREKEQQQQQQVQERAMQRMQQFFDEHEFAEVHATAIDTLIGKNPGMSPEKAYYEIRMFATQYGLDFSRDLGPQVAELARRQQGDPRQSDANRQDFRRARPMPNGSRAQAPMRDMAETNFASPNASWNDIIRDAMNNRG